MPPSPHRRLRAFAKDTKAASAVETALLLGLTATMVLAFKETGVGGLVRPAKTAFETLLRALSS